MVLFRQNVESSGTFVFEHCLLWGGMAGAYGAGMLMGYPGAAYAGEVVSARSNLLFYPTAATDTYLLTESLDSTYTERAVTVAGYNGMYNPVAGTCKYNAGGGSASVNGYAGLQVSDAGAFPNSQLGDGDFVANPDFADTDYRDIIGWANRTQGQSDTWAATIAYLQANPSLVPSMIQWVRAGYVPTNSAYLHATYPGDTLTTDANGNPLNGTVGPMGVALVKVVLAGLPACYPDGSSVARPVRQPRLSDALFSEIYG